MNTFKQHIPNFCSGFEPDTFTFETTEELLNSDTFKRYGTRPDFSHFALSDNLVMEINDGGKHWWVVGYVEKPDEVDLPQWDGGAM